MAESLLAKDQFYINGSFYNDTDEDQDAVITVKDSADILNRGEGWLVHVTRFSCDSMRSLAYIVADTSATWSIIAKDTAGTSSHVWDFTLDRDYATPHDLISEMNMKGRYMTTNRDKWEVYRFEIDAGGRFRLKMATTSGVSNGWHITYSGSESMNKLLGFETVTPFVQYAPDAAALFCRALDFMEKECNRANTPMNVSRGDLWVDTNEALIELLNGLEAKNMLTGTTLSTEVEPHLFSQLDMDGTTHASSLDSQYFKIGYKGDTITPQRNANEARLPLDGLDVICEFFTYSTATNDSRDNGPKTRTTKLHYRTGQSYLGTNGERTQGQVYFRDNASTGASPNNESPAKYPIYNPGSQHWTNSRYVYPFDSIPGYWFSGAGLHGSGHSVCIDSFITANGDRHRQFVLEHELPLHVKVGHDMYSQDMTNATHYNLVKAQHHAIEYIGEDRRTIHIDWPFGETTRADAAYNHLPLYFTDRRVPYQSRSNTLQGVTLWYTETIELDGVSTFCTVVNTFTENNITPGDTIRIASWNGQEWDFEFAVEYEVVKAEGETRRFWVRGEVGEELTRGLDGSVIVEYEQSAHLIARSIFVDKSKLDKIRWAQDTIRMKRAATTFRYEGRAHDTLTPAPGQWVNGVKFERAYLQSYNDIALRLQVHKFGEIIRGSKVFATGASTFAATSVTERVTGTMVSVIPRKSEEMEHNRGVDFGGQQLENLGYQPNLQTDMLRLMGSGHEPGDLCHRFAKPVWWGVKVFHEDTPLPQDSAERKRINAFVKNNPNDKPHIRFVGHNSASDVLWIQGYPIANYGGVSVSPIVTGVASRASERTTAAETDNFIIWAPPVVNNHQQIEAPTSLTSQAATAKKAVVSIQYDRLTRAYQLCKKEHTELAITNDSETRLYGEDGDYISSSLMSQIDAIFPYRQIILTSNDLMQIPERSQDVSISQPILSSYTLPTIIPTSVDKEGEASGGTSQPFGTVYFSEGGTRRFHHLNKVQGGMREFSVQAMLSYKNSATNPTTIRLQPGGQFTCQLLFVRKNDQ